MPNNPIICIIDFEMQLISLLSVSEVENANYSENPTRQHFFMFKKIISYLFPIRLKYLESPINGPMEVNLVDGRMTLDTQSSNYSYGSLQMILHYGLEKIGLSNQTHTIMLLGLGGGSVIQTIREDFKCQAYIEAVDIDPVIIEMAVDDFKINRFENIKIIHADAYQFVMNSSDLFDLIIVDLFIIDTIPVIFTTPAFLDSLKNHLTSKGKIIYNTMKRTMSTENLNLIKSQFEEDSHCHVKILKNVEGTNHLILVEKY